jgi:hypothetical protein
VPGAGVEPAWLCSRGILRPAAVIVLCPQGSAVLPRGQGFMAGVTLPEPAAGRLVSLSGLFPHAHERAYVYRVGRVKGWYPSAGVSLLKPAGGCFRIWCPVYSGLRRFARCCLCNGLRDSKRASFWPWLLRHKYVRLCDAGFVVANHLQY